MAHTSAWALEGMGMYKGRWTAPGRGRGIQWSMGVLLLGLAWAGTGAAAEPQFRALKIQTPPVLDGRLDDPVWREAPVVDQFFEVYPHALAPSTYPTEVRLLYDEHYLYVGFRAADPEPGLIRSHYVRRDRLYKPNSEDYVHIYLDALDTGKSAQMFAVNVQGNQLDGIWSEDSQTEDYTPDFDWQSYTARDAQGWTAVMRIPLTSLRYRPGSLQTWKLIAWRGIMRDNYYQVASTRIPADNNCLMCYAGDVALTDFPTDAGGGSLVLTPEYTLTHSSDSGDFGAASSNHGNLGGYLTWQPRAGTVVDGALNPDFSQVESDDFQPTANNQFALLYPEKRPFFLESTNLVNTPVQAIYTRTVSAPRWGARLTQQLDSGSYSLLATEDKGGGSIIEPGLLSSTLVPQFGQSLASFGRIQEFSGDWRGGMLYTWRRNADASRNLVLGPDLLWTPDDADRFKLQYIYSATRDPDRPDLLPDWKGQTLDDHALYADWTHATEAWTWETTYQRLGSGFRAWDGFVTQVGVRELNADLGYNLYPAKGGLLNIVNPQLVYAHSEDAAGDTVLNSLAPTLNLNGMLNSSITLAWHPADQKLTEAGLQRLRFWTLALTATPSARFVQLTTALTLGQNADFLTGATGHGPQATVTLEAFPVDQLELDLVDSYQRLDAETPIAADPRLFYEHGEQLRVLWFFTSRLYTELSAEDDVIRRNQANYALPVDAREENSLYTLQLAYELTPLSHVYAGWRLNGTHNTGAQPFAGDQRQFYLKMAYEFPM